MTANSSSNTPIIDLQQVTKVYHTDSLPVPILKGVSLQIYEGEFVAIMGASGSGKSTLLNLIGCLDRPTAGTYRVCGTDVASLDVDQLAALRSITFGFIFQRYNLLSTATAGENVELPAVYGRLSPQERTKRSLDLLTQLGLEDRIDHFPRQLSGGEQQRVAIARAVMNGGRVILADEPTGALDSKSGEIVMQLLTDLHKQGHTVIMVTHAMEVAKQAQRVIRVKDGLVIEDSGKAAKTTIAAPVDIQEKSKWDLQTLANAVKMSWRSLRAHGFRTLLTMLGIVIGVGSVVAMLAFGNGAKAAVLEKVRSMGTNLLVIRSGVRGLRGSFGGTSLTIDDARAVGELANVEYSVPETNKSTTLRYGETAYLTNIIGTSHEFTQVHEWYPSSASFFSEADTNSYAPVAVLGQTVVKNLFTDIPDPIGKFFLVGNVPFLVVGVMSSKGASLYGGDQDDAIWVPHTTGRARVYGGQPITNQVFVKVLNTDLINNVQDSVTALLLTRHRNLDFNIRNMESLLETATDTQNTLTLFLGAILDGGAI